MNKLQKEIKTYLGERGWDKLRPGDLAKSILIEGGELLEIFQWTNPELDQVLKDKEKLEKVRNELADVLTYGYDLAVILNLDVDDIIRTKLEKVKAKYPAKLFKKLKGEQGTHEIYLKIKSAHRRKEA